MAAITPETLQSIILQTLDASPSGTIDDSRALVGPTGRPIGTESQDAVKGVLYSLQSKEVRVIQLKRSQVGLRMRSCSRWSSLPK